VTEELKKKTNPTTKPKTSPILSCLLQQSIIVVICINHEPTATHSSHFFHCWHLEIVSDTERRSSKDSSSSNKSTIHHRFFESIPSIQLLRATIETNKYSQ